MSSLSAIALSGMQAAQAHVDASASNIANAQTPGYRRQAVVQEAQAEGGVAASVRREGEPSAPALETDLVAQLQAKNAFLANLAVFKTHNQMAGALLDKEA